MDLASGYRQISWSGDTCGKWRLHLRVITVLGHAIGAWQHVGHIQAPRESGIVWPPVGLISGLHWRYYHIWQWLWRHATEFVCCTGSGRHVWLAVNLRNVICLFLSHTGGCNWLSCDPVKLEVVYDSRTSIDIKGIQKFEISGIRKRYCCRFVPNFVNMVAPMIELPVNNCRFDRSEKCDRSFRSIRQSVMPCCQPQCWSSHDVVNHILSTQIIVITILVWSNL
jgi:hypothetical protein